MQKYAFYMCFKRCVNPFGSTLEPFHAWASDFENQAPDFQDQGSLWVLGFGLQKLGFGLLGNSLIGTRDPGAGGEGVEGG